ncbi:MAG: hypothetical protein QOI83_1051, partial [Streptomycetaceae bacterium]|nr:hypothetical protein [Streptomycetaceae bacterium]
PVLGLIEDARFSVVSGHLDHGDAAMLFTDGLVENPHRDISLGVDKLMGQAGCAASAGLRRRVAAGTAVVRWCGGHGSG